MRNDSFIDFYEVLQVSPNAETETINRTYRMLALRYHPDNKETGDADAFKLLIQAHRTLSDPEQRAVYDIEHGTTRKLRWKIFDQPKSAQGIEGEKRKRRGILSLLYTKRVHVPHDPGMTIKEMEDLLGCPREHLEFSLWYLKENQWVQRGDNGRFVITAKGVDAVESAGESHLQDNRLLAAPKSSAAYENPKPWGGTYPQTVGTA